MKELVSVIIPFLNEENYIKASVESILNQTYKNLEILLIDDYSTDTSVEICKSFDDKRVVIYSKKTEPRGVGASRNLGIELAKGDYVVFHDADDVSLPTRVEKQVEMIKKYGDNTIAGTWAIRIIDGKAHKMNLPVEHEDIIKGFERIHNRTTIVGGIICFKKKIYNDHKYNANLKYFEDWDFLLRLYESGNFTFHNVPEYLYHYLIKPSGTLFREDWIDWNLVVRKNQERRKKNLPEFIDPDEMYKAIRSSPIEFVKLHIIKFLINLKNRIIYM